METEQVQDVSSSFLEHVTLRLEAVRLRRMNRLGKCLPFKPSPWFELSRYPD